MASSFEQPEVSSLRELNRLARAESWALLADGDGSFLFPETQAVCDIWHRKAAPGRLPFRSEFTARLLKPYLRLLVIQERVTVPGGRRYRSRLMGEAVTAMIGDASGKFFEEFLRPPALRTWNAMADAVLAHGGAVRFLIRADGFAEGGRAGEIFAAPVLTADGRPDLILAAGRFEIPWKWNELAADWRRDRPDD